MDGEVIIGTKLETKGFDKQIKEVESRLNDIEATLEMSEKDKKMFSTTEIIAMEKEAEKLKNTLIDLRKKQADIDSQGFKNVQGIIENIGTGLENTIRKVTRWGLALFGVRSAYSAIRSAMSTLSQYNEDIEENVNYIRYLLASTLEPVIRRIIQLANTLLAYIRYIIKAWTGKDIFNTSKYFESMNKSSAGVAKNAKEIRKQLAGFDEMNILHEDGSVSSLGGGVASAVSLPDLDDVPIPEWIKRIADNKDMILGFLKTAGILIAGLKLANLLIRLTGVGKGLTDIFKIMKNIGALKTLAFIAGIATAITGIIIAIQGVIAFIKDPSWENFNKILEGLSLTLFGVGLAMVSLNASNPVGWILIATGAVMSFVSALIKDRAQIMSVEDAQRQLEQSTLNVINATNDYVNAIDNAENAQKNLEEAQRKNKISIDDLLKMMEKENLSYEDLNDKQKEVYKAYLNNEMAQQRVKETTDKLNESKKQEVRDSIEATLANAKESGSYDKLKESIIDAWNNGEIKTDEARDYIERAMSQMSDSAKTTFEEDLPTAIRNGLDSSKYDSWGKKLKNWFSGLWKSIWGGAPSTSGKINVSYSGGGGGGFATGGIVYSQVPRLASGGIINQPGYGVPLASAIGGENGREGVIPLTDKQAMAELGAEIGRNVILNLTNITKLDNRQIAREQKRINAESDFAYNR